MNEMNKLQVGDVIKIKEGDCIYYQKGIITVSDSYSFLVGEYGVLNVQWEQLGYGYGGYHIFCSKIDDVSTIISFYQSGITSNVVDTTIVGKAKLKWEVVENE